MGMQVTANIDKIGSVFFGELLYLVPEHNGLVMIRGKSKQLEGAASYEPRAASIIRSKRLEARSSQLVAIKTNFPV
jgi:hypothetical protein